jgi:outer membrane protein OmpA-like peptidoglycan-associated protein
MIVKRNFFKTSNLFRQIILLFCMIDFGLSSIHSQESPLNQKLKPSDFPTKGVFYFAEKSFKVSAPDLKKIQTIAEYLVKNQNASIYIRGHAWDHGTNIQEIDLSEKRSLEFARFLQMNGVKEQQIHILFYGNSRPMDHGLTTGDQAIQRRVEYTLVIE